MAVFMFWGGLSTLIHRYAQRFATIVIPNFIKLTIEIKHHDLFTIPYIDAFVSLFSGMEEISGPGVA